MALHHGDDGTLLNGGRSLETAIPSREGDGSKKKHPPVCVDPTKELRPEIHVVEATVCAQNESVDQTISRLFDKLLVNDLIPV
jgi:hypothetical protein